MSVVANLRASHGSNSLFPKPQLGRGCVLAALCRACRMPQVVIAVESDHGFNKVRRPGFDLVIDLREVFADDAQADHDEAPYDQQRNDRGGKAGYGATLKP